jgi:hypothetical protein
MASKKSVNLENLEALGARRLAKIVLELGALIPAHRSSDLSR